eukprot:COSAG06_NODE_34784_length_469_cov_1.072973_1_plen_52_part_10
MRTLMPWSHIDTAQLYSPLRLRGAVFGRSHGSITVSEGGSMATRGGVDYSNR